MPWYDYHCEECEEAFEVRRPMSESGEDRAPACPRCGSRTTRRVFGNVFTGTSGCEPSGST